MATRRTLTTLLTRTLSRNSSILSPTTRYSLSSIQSHFQPSLPQNSSSIQTRFKTSGSGYSPLNDPSPNWTNRPPKETILLDGCDYEHWLIVMEFPNDPKPSDEEMVNSYVNILAQVVGSEEEARKKIYSVSTTTYTGFGALISEELSYKVKALPGVLWVLPDSYLDVPNKDYGGDLFIDGKVIRRPQYDYSDRQQNTRTRSRPRYDKRRERVQNVGRVPIQTQPPSWSQDNTQTMQQQTSMNDTNTTQNHGNNPVILNIPTSKFVSHRNTMTGY
ncbi:multiple organellar RNA editing factor 3, mitochondrial isoform X2 [Beta vulgaris subsp. vulgaris]|uniref:multiple organellar RNA editing factor 3, mitochondrial isoform X2 n=1 Tax=Beta vulgaris subsp. vulgaris TaxID=3555 RepID=UPI002036D6E8|nr:multiple organellar RNA editing factor 3, mitochondrial isoform X2 [Beta vulgaris subsp. vulgaris]